MHETCLEQFPCLKCHNIVNQHIAALNSNINEKSCFKCKNRVRLFDTNCKKCSISVVNTKAEQERIKENLKLLQNIRYNERFMFDTCRK